MIPKPLDSRGRESITLGLVIPAYAVLLAKFAGAGVSIPYLGTIPAMSGTEFAAAFAAVLGVWLTREWQEKKTS